ncbi:PREDICTED: protein gamma response 1-like isoform X2 [Dinoponera quadriceps]|nr:PREDICTED: protein gamma response 1-like isoform X2 [Dinoponera quadriceps]XP_014479424.1 PREDICTED: protein gamma response 1-like isoform X2 [Dinoponera quadriceps]
MTIDNSSVKTEDELTIQKQLNNRVVLPESNVSLLEMDSSDLDAGGQKFPHIDTENKPVNLSDDFLDCSPPKSPVFSRTYPKANGTFAKRFVRSPEAAASSSVRSEATSADRKMHRKDRKFPSQSNQKLKISTTYHVETTFLSNGKKLKQSRLEFPVEHDKKKIPPLDVGELKPTGTIREAKQNLTDTSVAKTPVITEDDTARTNETWFEDAMEISPTQKDVQTSKSRHCLKLKRKVPKQTVNNSPDKNKHHHLGPDFANAKAEVGDTDFNLSLSPERTSAEVIYDKSVAKNSDRTVQVFKHNVNAYNLSLTRKYNKADGKNTMSIDDERKDQGIVKDEVQNISENSGDLYEDEVLYLSAERTANKNDTDNFNLDDTENKPPAKKLSKKTIKSLIWSTKKENVSERLNARSKADRAKLNGSDCWECEEYYKNLSLSKEELKKRKNQCSRHRHKYERPTTPEGFWDPGFPETLSCTYRYNIK